MLGLLTSFGLLLLTGWQFPEPPRAFPDIPKLLAEAGGSDESKAKALITTFDVKSNVWISHVWFAPGTFHYDAIKALQKIGKRAVPPLIDALKAEKPEKRYLAVMALGPIRDPMAADALMDAFAHDVFWGVQQGAAEALMTQKDPRSVSLLLDGMREGATWRRRWSAYALAAFPEPRVVSALAAALSLNPPEKYSQEWDIGETAGYSLGRMGKPALDALLRAAKDQNAVVRQNAAYGLGEIKAVEAASALAELLKDPKAEIRSRVASQFGWMDDRAGVPALLQTLSDTDANVRSAAAESLGKLGDRRASTGLIRLLKDRDATVTEAAARALGQLKAPDAVKPLIALCSSGSTSLRATAAHSLGQIGDQAAQDHLLKLAGSSDEYVRALAVGALGAMRGDRPYEAALKALKDNDEYVRACAAEALGFQGRKAAVPALIKALEDGESVRANAATALGRLKAREAIPALKAMIKRDDRSYPLYSKAQEAIAYIEGQRPRLEREEE